MSMLKNWNLLGKVFKKMASNIIFEILLGKIFFRDEIFTCPYIFVRKKMFSL